MVEAAATTALRAARRLQLAVEARNTVGLQRVVQAASALQAAIQQSVLCRETRISGRWGKLQSAPQLRNKYNYLKRKLDQAKRAQDHKLRQCNNSIANYWIVHAGLSDPGLSTRSVADWCGDFHVTAPPLAASSVVNVRDAFCETLKDMARTRLRDFCAYTPHGWILMKQVHDEASMRLRSFLPGSEGIKRGRNSSVQNSVLTVHRGASPDDVVRMPLELIAMERKNARTLATALPFPW